MGDVARAYPGAPFPQVLRQPWALTLYQWALLIEAKAMDGVLAMAERMELGAMMVYAFNDPKQMKKMEVRFKARAGLFKPNKEVKERALAMHNRLKALGVLDDA